MRRWTVVPTLLLILLVACQAPAPAVLTAIRVTAELGATVKPSPTLLPTDTPAPLPTNTRQLPPSSTATSVKSESPTPPAPTPTATPVRPKSPADLTAWNFVDPRDPTRGDVIIRDGDTYRLDPKWEVKAIEYVDRWEGEIPSFEVKKIEQDGNEFKLGSVVVSISNVHTLLASISRLYPVQSMLEGYPPPEIYPSLSVELTGKDGRHVQVLSRYSTEWGDAPWVVIDNGRLYAQYDGSLAIPLDTIFNPDGAAYWGKKPKYSSLSYETKKTLPALKYGFDGLLLIARDFQYRTIAETRTIEGQIDTNRFWYPQEDGSGILKRVELMLPDGSTLPCVIKPMDEETYDWPFECKLSTAVAGQPYRYPITIEVYDEDGVPVVVAGELHGQWGADPNRIPVLPLPPAIETAFNANAQARDLLRDHVAILSYGASISPALPLHGELDGSAVLLGQTQLHGQPVRYTIGTPFLIKDGQLKYWTLSRGALDQLLYDVTALTLTQRVLSAVPSAQLNLWYAERDASMGVDDIYTRWHPFSIDLPNCGGIAPQQLPRLDMPLRAFGFNSSWQTGSMNADFVLVEGQPIVYLLWLSPGSAGERQTVEVLLLPKVLETGSARPFADVQMWPPKLTVYFSDEATTADRMKYDQIVAALPVTTPLVTSDDSGIAAENVTFVINEQGELEVAACQP